IDQWTPGGAVTDHNLAPLDRWVLSELHALAAEVDAALGRYDVPGAVRRVESFVENLSNWYVRRSRRRFWRTTSDADKRAAYATLYECLVTLSKLMAPFTPFLSEEIYQNLVRSVDQNAPESVHHCDFPQTTAGMIDEQLMADTRLVMRLASLGLAARKSASLKVRQPLAEALVYVPDTAERAAAQRLSDQLLEEWNVKAVRFVNSKHDLSDLRLNPLPNKLGPKLGANFGKVRQALLAAEVEHAARLDSGETVALLVSGQSFEVQPDDVEVRLTALPGWALASDSGYVVSVSTTLTDSLRREGLSRELVRQYNDLRKTAGLRVEELIHATWTGASSWQPVFAEFGDLIRQETLSVDLKYQASAPAGATSATVSLGAGELVITVRPAVGAGLVPAQVEPPASNDRAGRL
ncbi:MAG: class I tRNA ligase family protein, partial [Chloroflexi bacterium]|nr:class I tRNA ligase family protein [Chloroflexota bacterium]